MEHHTSPTLVRDRSDTPQNLISRLYERGPTTLCRRVTFGTFDPPDEWIDVLPPAALSILMGRAVAAARAAFPPWSETSARSLASYCVGFAQIRARGWAPYFVAVPELSRRLVGPIPEMRRGHPGRVAAPLMS